MSLHTAQSLAPPRAAHQLDSTKLLQYLKEAVPSLKHASKIEILQFQHGQSNPTYLVVLNDTKYVLRKKPPGKLLASAHAVDREFKVLSGLSSVGVPIPRPLVYCDSSSVIGTPFYMMQFLEGRVYLDPNLPDMVPARRQQIYQQMSSCLAALHDVDPSKVGLQDYGNANNYCRRQLQRWSKQYHASVDTPMPEVLKLTSWLDTHVPASDAAVERPGICHGDYRLDNLVFSEEDTPRALGILDWELSTVGNTWADVAYNCLPYHLPADVIAVPCLKQPLAAGIPSESEHLAHYCRQRNLQPPSAQDWAFYLALGIFRLVAILAGVQARSRQGNASSANAAQASSESVQAALVRSGLQIIAAAGPGPVSGPQTAQRGLLAGSSKAFQLLAKLQAFMAREVYPSESDFEEHSISTQRWTIHPRMEQLKQLAKQEGLWNLWLPVSLAKKLQHLLPLASCDLDRSVLLGAGLSHLDYARLCEEMGRSVWAPEVFNCSAPDTGNMEVLAKYGTAEQQREWLLPLLEGRIRLCFAVTQICLQVLAKYGTAEQQREWLLPLLEGRIRSCFAMTEKAVASSDATNIQASIVRDGGELLLNGVKWWTSGAMDPRCKLAIFMGKTDPSGPKHQQQSMVLVPMAARGVAVVRPMMVYGHDDAPHGHAEVHFSGVRVPAGNIILGEGRGFEIAQGRLGPGRLHHCMRLMGMAERSLELMAQRAQQRTVFGKPLAQQGAFRSELGNCRIELDAARLLVLNAAHALDQVGNKEAAGDIAAAKVAAPRAALCVIDAAIQAHGAAGVSQDTVLARLWTHARTLRIADGPDEVHLQAIARLELKRASKL